TAEALAAPGVPRLSWAADYLAAFGLTSGRSLRVVLLAYIGGLACLLVGWHSRVAAVVAWLGHLMIFDVTGYPATYGVDFFAGFSLFYFLFMPVADAVSLDCLEGRCTHIATPA